MAKVTHVEIPPAKTVPTHELTLVLSEDEFRLFNKMCGKNNTSARALHAAEVIDSCEEITMLSRLLGDLHQWSK